ncbi:down syndrome cell adhesion molecule-like protein Dscam2 [Trichonephila clavipes]|nr:down syndrome cell adhesion molecule-like protein Dscam2 [Trichonephila clavipes]
MSPVFPVNFIDDTPREDRLDLLILARAEAANNAYEAHLENKRRFDLHRRSHSFKAGDLVLYDWPKQGDHKLSPIFKGPFVIVRPVGANNTSDEENDSSAENQDPTKDHQEVSVTTESSSSRNPLRRNRRPPKRFEQYVF